MFNYNTISLTNRIILFFMGSMACILVVFSFLLYLIVYLFLMFETESRTVSALNVLSAGVEVLSDGVKWEPSERQITLGEGIFGGTIEWAVLDKQGKEIDQSKVWSVFKFEKQENVINYQGVHLSEDKKNYIGLCLIKPSGFVPLNREDPFLEKGKEPKYLGLTPVVVLSLQPVYLVLGKLRIGLFLLVLIIWVGVFILGKFVCTNAIFPLRKLSAIAENINGNDLSLRIPEVKTKDEVGVLVSSLNALLSRLEESFAKQKRFTGDASHQMRTPLTVILGQLEVALRYERPIVEYQRVMQKVQLKALELKGIIEALLFLARNEIDSLLPNLTSVDLCVWCDQYLCTWQENNRWQDLKIIRQEEPIWVSVHPVLLNELMNNLVENAIKFSKQGSEIIIEIKKELGVVVLTVQDFGCGISEEEINSLFDSFYRGNEARIQGTLGCGLGLTIAKRIAGEFGATLKLASKLSVGTTATIRFPVFLLEEGTQTKFLCQKM